MRALKFVGLLLLSGVFFAPVSKADEGLEPFEFELYDQIENTEMPSAKIKGMQKLYRHFYSVTEVEINEEHVLNMRKNEHPEELIQLLKTIVGKTLKPESNGVGDIFNGPTQDGVLKFGLVCGPYSGSTCEFYAELTKNSGESIIWEFLARQITPNQ